jgi:hypothetical protein
MLTMDQKAQAEFQRALEEGDLESLRRIWAGLNPGMPVLSRSDAEASMHMARTQAESVSPRGRCYSHRWLEERNLPSQLPDHLKPEADRWYPRVEETVGISLNFKSEWMRPAADMVRGAMEYSVLDSFADGTRDPSVVKTRMMDAKDREMRSLFGKLRSGA